MLGRLIAAPADAAQPLIGNQLNDWFFSLLQKCNKKSKEGQQLQLVLFVAPPSKPEDAQPRYDRCCCACSLRIIMANCAVNMFAYACRFSITVIDAPPGKKTKSGSNKCAVLIVPQGREQEWLFAQRAGKAAITSFCLFCGVSLRFACSLRLSTGQEQLAQQIGFGRLILVFLSRTHFAGKIVKLPEIQEELAMTAKALAPDDLRGAIPFTTIAEDLGQRKPLCEQKTDSGLCLIEDVCHNSAPIKKKPAKPGDSSGEPFAACPLASAHQVWYRRMLFPPSPAVQSEVEVISMCCCSGSARVLHLISCL